MGYQLRAFIGKSQPIQRLPKESSVEYRVTLAQDLTMILLTDEFFDNLSERFPSDANDPYEGFSFLNDSVSQWAMQLSKTTPIAYVEADYFGGNGSQSAIAWDAGVVKLGPLPGKFGGVDQATGPINQALRFLGAQLMSARDEFEAVGLQRGRDHEDWLKISDN